MNPLNTLDSLLNDWASARVRRLIHAGLALALLVFTAYEAADENWKVAIISLLGTLYAAANKANTDTVSVETYEADDDLSYEESGGQPFPED